MNEHFHFFSGGAVEQEYKCTFENFEYKFLLIVIRIQDKGIQALAKKLSRNKSFLDNTLYLCSVIATAQ